MAVSLRDAKAEGHGYARRHIQTEVANDHIHNHAHEGYRLHSHYWRCAFSMCIVKHKNTTFSLWSCIATC